jgi:hypothetical protein
MTNLVSPVYHELRYMPGHFSRVFWPLNSRKNESPVIVRIETGKTYELQNGQRVLVTDIYKTDKYMLVEYMVEANDVDPDYWPDQPHYNSPISWFASCINTIK